MNEFEKDTRYCPTCNSERLVRVHRTKSERKWIKAKYFCQNCGDRFVIKRTEIKLLLGLMNGGRAACARVKDKLARSATFMNLHRKKKGPHAPV